jgi:HlyD family secretion protein
LSTNNQIPTPEIATAEHVSFTKNSFDDHGNEITEIISKKLPTIVRWGTVYFLFLLLLLAAICWFIQYPDIVITKATLTSINAPKTIVTKTSGKLIKLFATEGTLVRSGSIVGYMESTANHAEVINLAKSMDSMEAIISNNETEKLLPYLNTSWQNLGELQQAYQTFLQSFISFRNSISGGFYLRKKSMLTKDEAFLKALHNNLLQQKGLNTQDLELSTKTFAANESLNTDKVISDVDFRNEQSKLIGKQLSLPQMNAAIIGNEAQQNEKQKEIAELENTIAQQKNIFLQSLNTFKSQIADWQKKYLLTAPVSGSISFASFLQENQQLQLNQIICFVNPANAQYYAEVYIPQTNLGKVKTGQEVLLKFPSYPFQEYGSVIGSIAFISNIPTDSGYAAKVLLPQGLQTSYHKQVQFREGLQAQGEIITTNMRLLQRFYYGFIRQLKR